MFALLNNSCGVSLHTYRGSLQHVFHSLKISCLNPFKDPAIGKVVDALLHTFPLTWDHVRVDFCQFMMTQGQQMLKSDSHTMAPRHIAHIPSCSHSFTAGELVQLFHNHPVRPKHHNVYNVLQCNSGRNRHIAISRSSIMSAFNLVSNGSSGPFVMKSSSFTVSKGKPSVTKAVASYVCSHCLQGVSRYATSSSS